MTSDQIALAGLISSTVTALCALYVAFVALQQSSRPRINVQFLGPRSVVGGQETTFLFRVENLGHWYASPPALNVVVFCNFEQSFSLRELRYGSAQEITNSHVRVGKRGLTFIRAKEIKLSHRGDAEDIHVAGTPPTWPGRFRIWVSAFSDNGATFQREFWFNVVDGN